MLALVTRVGENIRRLRDRKAADESQGEFAARVGVTQSQLSDWEHSRYLPDTASLLKLAKALDCTIDEILDGVDAEYDAIRAKRDLIRQDDAPADTRNFTRRHRDFVAAIQAMSDRLVEVLTTEKKQR